MMYQASVSDVILDHVSRICGAGIAIYTIVMFVSTTVSSLLVHMKK